MAHQMAHYDIFRHHLAMTFPAYGFPIWEPSPGNLFPAVEIGDVGHICQGKFRRLFNVLLPADHPSHQNIGVPEYHEQLTLNIGNHIDVGTLSPHNFYSAGVTLRPESDRWADGPPNEGELSFSCPMKEGAVLCLPVQAKRVDTIAKPDFGKWMIKHIDRWFLWARQRGLEINRMEDIILVTGTHHTRSWTNVAFPGGQGDAQASFAAKVEHRSRDTVAINWQYPQERNRGAVLNRGPNGENLPEDQGIFIRGYRVTRKLKILSLRLKAAAGPCPDPEGSDEEPDAELISIPAVPKYRDPLHTLLEYIAEEAPSDCDMVLVHDDDLAKLDGIYDGKPDALQSDLVLSRIRSLKPTVHTAEIDLSSTGADIGSASVASLSNMFQNQSSSSTSPASQAPNATTLRPENERGRPSDIQTSRRSYYPLADIPPYRGHSTKLNVPGSEGHLQKNMGHSTNYPTQAGERPYPLHPALSPPTSALEIVTPRVLEPYHLHPALSPPTSVLEFVTPRVLEPFSSQHRIGRVNHRSSASPPIFPPDPLYCTSPFNNPGVLLPLTRHVPRPRPLTGFPMPQPPGNHQCPPGPPSRFPPMLIPRLEAIPPQPGTGHLNYDVRSPPYTHSQRRTRLRAPAQPSHSIFETLTPCHSGVMETPYYRPPLPGGNPSYGGCYDPRASALPHQRVYNSPTANHDLSWNQNISRAQSFRQAQPHDAGSHGHQARQTPVPVSRPYSPRGGGKKKALLIGIDYSRQRERKLRLKGAIDVLENMSRSLQEHLDFHPNNIRVLTDDKHDERENRPTEANIRGAMHGLVEGAQPGDSLFFYLSGHATQIKDKGGHGPNECLCAADYDDINPPTGLISDNTMHDIMVKNLPRGCCLTTVFDCCHSGTPLGLPYVYDSHGMLEPSRQDTARRKTSEVNVVCLSACQDSGRAPVPEDGSLGRAFIEYVSRWGNRGTYLDMIQSIGAYMTASGLGQRLQLSSSRLIDTSQLIHIRREMFGLVPQYEDQDVDNPAGRATRTDSEMDNDLTIKHLIVQPDP